MTERRKTSVAIIGLGATGLTTLKNFLEAGFDATGFDCNNFVGGLWQYTDDTDRTSVLKTTVANLSKQLGCYTDFPYPKETGDFPNAAEVAQYLNNYADHFDLRRHIRLGKPIKSISRTDEKWRLEFGCSAQGEPSMMLFDKVAVCAGLAVQQPKIPVIPGLEDFKGTAIHSNGYTNSESFAGKRVLVVGLGNTGPDIAVDLVDVASNVWLSYRRGNAIFSRRDDKGKPRDHILSLRLVKLGGIFNKHFPSLASSMSLVGMRRMQKQSFDIKPEWNLGVPQYATRKVATMNDELVPAVRSGKVGLKSGLSRVEGSTAIFSDGSTLENIDVIILATGFKADYSFMSREADPTRETRSDWSSLPSADGRPLPRLYQGIFSLDFPDSLCFLGNSPLTPQANLNYDISSAAVAQIWAGKSSLPSRSEMNAHVDAQHEEVYQVASTGELANTNLRNNWDWFKWCDEAAGLGVVKRAGYGIEGWKFWMEDMQLCRLVTDGLMSPHIFRLFDEGKRKAWSEAKRAIEAANAER